MGLLGVRRRLAVVVGKQPWMPQFLPQVVAVDMRLQRATRGKVSVLDLADLPNLTLTVAGRKSGIPRSTPLLCVPDGGTWLVAGSYFGAPAMPVWVHNLRAATTATISVGGTPHEVVAEELTGDARAEAWATMVRTWPNFTLYEQKTDRTIPVFRLRPA